MSRAVEGEGVRLRRATRDDVSYLVALGRHPEVAAALAAVSPWEEERVRCSLEVAEADQVAEGRFVIEAREPGGRWVPAGGVAFVVRNRRSRIAHLFGLMVEPGLRRGGVGLAAVRLLSRHLVCELGYHRIELETYGFNHAAQRLFERAGFVREGVKRKAYWRNGVWNDGVLFGLVEEDLLSREGDRSPVRARRSG